MSRLISSSPLFFSPLLVDAHTLRQRHRPLSVFGALSSSFYFYFPYNTVYIYTRLLYSTGIELVLSTKKWRAKGVPEVGRDKPNCVPSTSSSSLLRRVVFRSTFVIELRVIMEAVMGNWQSRRWRRRCRRLHPNPNPPLFASLCCFLFIYFFYHFICNILY